MSTDDRTTRYHNPTNPVVRPAVHKPHSCSACRPDHTCKDYATYRGLGAACTQETCLPVCTETRLAHTTPKPTVKARRGERQDLIDASSAVGTLRTDVGALDAVISCDVRQCTRCEKCA